MLLSLTLQRQGHYLEYPGPTVCLPKKARTHPTKLESQIVIPLQQPAQSGEPPLMGYEMLYLKTEIMVIPGVVC